MFFSLISNLLSISAMDIKSSKMSNDIFLNYDYTQESLIAPVKLTRSKEFLINSSDDFKNILKRLSTFENENQLFTSKLRDPIRIITEFLIKNTFNSDIGKYIESVIDKDTFTKLDLQSYKIKSIRCLEYFIYNLFKNEIPDSEDDVALYLYEFLIKNGDTDKVLASTYTNIVSGIVSVTKNNLKN